MPSPTTRPKVPTTVANKPIFMMVLFSSLGVVLDTLGRIIDSASANQQRNRKLTPTSLACNDLGSTYSGLCWHSGAREMIEAQVGKLRKDHLLSYLHYNRRNEHHRQRRDIDVNTSSPIIWARKLRKSNEGSSDDAIHSSHSTFTLTIRCDLMTPSRFASVSGQGCFAMLCPQRIHPLHLARVPQN